MNSPVPVHEIRFLRLADYAILGLTLICLVSYTNNFKHGIIIIYYRSGVDDLLSVSA